MKIIKLKAENVKRLKAALKSPQGVRCSRSPGATSQGKTSLLDAIWWALGGTKDIQSKPIRKGALEASVELDLGEYIVSRRWTHKGSYLHVRQRDETRPDSGSRLPPTGSTRRHAEQGCVRSPVLHAS